VRESVASLEEQAEIERTWLRERVQELRCLECFGQGHTSPPAAAKATFHPWLPRAEGPRRVPRRAPFVTNPGEGYRDPRGVGPTQPAAEDSRAPGDLHGRRSCSTGPSASSPTPCTRTDEQLSLGPPGCLPAKPPSGSLARRGGVPALWSRVFTPNGSGTPASLRLLRSLGDTGAPGGRVKTHFEPPSPLERGSLAPGDAVCNRPAGGRIER
jgi:hypothetical protein